MIRDPLQRIQVALGVAALGGTALMVAARLWDTGGSWYCRGESSDVYINAYYDVYLGYVWGIVATTIGVVIVGLVRPKAVNQFVVLALALCAAVNGSTMDGLGPCG